MIEPMIEAFTTSVSPAERAMMVIMSSAALPKVALSMPPMLGPVKCATLSVACPRTQAYKGEGGDGEEDQDRCVDKLRDDSSHCEEGREPVKNIAHLWLAPPRSRMLA